MLGSARTAMVLTSRGAEQQSHGVDNVLAFINIALALGKVGRPFSGYGTMTGQGNGQGGREHGQKADQLPGYRRIDDPAARRARRGGLGNPGSGSAGSRQVGVRADRICRRAGRHPRAARRRVESRRCRRRTRRTSPSRLEAPRLSRRRRFLPVRDRERRRRGAARRRSGRKKRAPSPISRGASSAAGARSRRRRRCAPISIFCATSRSARQVRSSSFDGSRRRYSRSCGAATRGGAADYSGISYDRIDREGGVFWPCPDGRSSGDAAPVRGHVSDAERPRALSSPSNTAARRKCPTSTFRCTSRPAACSRTISQERRRGASRSSSRPRRSRSPKFIRSVAKRHGLVDGAPVILRTRRGIGDLHQPHHADIRPDTVFVPFHWPGESSANRLTNDALDPVSRMPEFKVCAVRIERADE